MKDFRPKQFALLGLFIFLASLLGGCVTATVQEMRESATGLTGDEAVVVIGRRSRPSPQETEFDFIQCVAKDLQSGSGGITVISEQQFMDATFPWFEPRTAPERTSDLPALLEEPLLAERLEEIGLKYLVWIEGQTIRTSSAGSLGCTVSGAGGGCFGFLTWENDASYEATVWDTKKVRSVGRVSSDAAGTSYMPALIIPIPIIAQVKNNACDGLATQLRTFMTETAGAGSSG
tara:strand:+ start:1577 stop:2275 length:699 start_codon:yes stop_codon:yes gene_type:complete